MAEAYIVDAARSPTGRRGGSLAQVHAADLGAHVIKALVERNDIPDVDYDDVIFGAVDAIGPVGGSLRVEGIDHRDLLAEDAYPEIAERGAVADPVATAPTARSSIACKWSLTRRPMTCPLTPKALTGWPRSWVPKPSPK